MTGVNFVKDTYASPEIIDDYTNQDGTNIVIHCNDGMYKKLIMHGLRVYFLLLTIQFNYIFYI